MAATRFPVKHLKEHWSTSAFRLRIRQRPCSHQFPVKRAGSDAASSRRAEPVIGAAETVHVTGCDAFPPRDIARRAPRVLMYRVSRETRKPTRMRTSLDKRMLVGIRTSRADDSSTLERDGRDERTEAAAGEDAPIRRSALALEVAGFTRNRGGAPDGRPRRDPWRRPEYDAGPRRGDHHHFCALSRIVARRRSVRVRTGEQCRCRSPCTVCTEMWMNNLWTAVAIVE